MMDSLISFRNSISDYYLAIGQLGPVWIFVLAAVIFMPLALIVPGRRSQPLVHTGMLPDALYWFLGGPFIYSHAAGAIGNALVYLLIASGMYSIENIHHLHEGLPPVSHLNIVLQAFLILLIMDFCQYWTHRMFHNNLFWKFHAIHHSAKNVDWLTAARFHPVNIIVHSTFVGTAVYMIGFSPEAWLVLAPFNIIYSPLVHANVNWTYGPFRYFLASPVFHRWHHTFLKEGGNKNFAPTFPILDIIFGTYYDPKDKKPEMFGTEHDPISDDNVLQQLIYPFVRRPKVSKEIAEAEMAQADKETSTTEVQHG